MQKVRLIGHGETKNTAQGARAIGRTATTSILQSSTTQVGLLHFARARRFASSGGGGGDVETLHGVLLRGPGRAFWHLLLTPGHPKKPGITCRLAYGMALAGSWVCKEETLLCDALSQNPDVGAEDAFIKL